MLLYNTLSDLDFSFNSSMHSDQFFSAFVRGKYSYRLTITKVRCLTHYVPSTMLSGIPWRRALCKCCELDTVNTLWRSCFWRASTVSNWVQIYQSILSYSRVVDILHHHQLNVLPVRNFLQKIRYDCFICSVGTLLSLRRLFTLFSCTATSRWHPSENRKTKSESSSKHIPRFSFVIARCFLMYFSQVAEMVPVMHYR